MIMLPVKFRTGSGPLIVMLHWLGGSSSTWNEVMDGCSAAGLACAAIDLPGFGDAAQSAVPDVDTFTVAASVDAVLSTIQTMRSGSRTPWLLAGHSMGGKFAAILARASLDGAPGLEDLQGLILISPSPPGPEPMEESVRHKNVESLGRSTLDGNILDTSILDTSRDRAHAEEFVDANTGKLPLPADIRTRTVDDLLRMDRSAFIDWFAIGSREDWASRVGTIAYPALILVGTTESALGPDAQTEHTLPHFSNATLVPLEGAGHLSPLERPAELALRIVAFVKQLGLALPSAALAPAARTLIDSTLTSPQTRDVLDRRLNDDDLAEPGILSGDEMLTLRSVASRIIPGCPFDLGGRLHRWLALPAHDGWRHDNLPPDIEAWRNGLHSLDAASNREHGVPFSALDSARQDDLLTQARDGKLGRSLLETLHLGEDHHLYTAAQMSDWFGDLHAELTRFYVADPRTMHRIGFTGFADEAGFTHIRLNEREEFEG